MLGIRRALWVEIYKIYHLKRQLWEPSSRRRCIYHDYPTINDQLEGKFQ